MYKFVTTPGFRAFLGFCVVISGLVVPQILFKTSVFKSSNADAGLAAEELTTQVMKNVKLKSSKGSKVEWSMDSATATAFSSNTWKLKDCKLSLFNEKSSVDLTSRSGFVDLNTKNMNLIGDVKAVSTNGFTFKTNELFFNNERKETSTDGAIELVNKSEKIKVNAVGLRGNLETGELELLSEVRCEQSILGYDNIVIKSNKAKIRSSLNDIRFMDNLRVSQKMFTIKGDEAFFAYDRNKKTELKSIKVQGNIRASDGIKTAISEKVEFKVREDVILFQGNPKLIMGDNEMVGDEILITNQQKNIQVLGGNIKANNEELEK